jgi:hypothetical protein
MNIYAALQPLMAIVLNLLILVASMYIVEHSITGALKAVKFAFKSEFKTDTGKINVLGLAVLVVIYVFSDIHEYAANSMSLVKPAPAENRATVAVFLFGFFFILSLICVLKMERSDAKSNESVPGPGRPAN